MAASTAATALLVPKRSMLSLLSSTNTVASAYAVSARATLASEDSLSDAGAGPTSIRASAAQSRSMTHSGRPAVRSSVGSWITTGTPSRESCTSNST